MNRKERAIQKSRRETRAALVIFAAIALFFCVDLYLMQKAPAKSAGGTPDTALTADKNKGSGDQKEAAKKDADSTPKKVTITASGDMLYHYILYGSAYDGKNYDLSNDFEQIKPLMDKADLCLGDFEGTINPDMPLSGYPMFNAPADVAKSIQQAGFDVIDLGHNHILDTGIDGLLSTAKTFHDLNVDTIGVNTDENSDILVKEVNGIKIALLAYAYGFNGMENTLTQEEYDKYLHDLNMDKVAADLKKAEEIADITVVMPQDGEEYSLQPNEEQQQKYRQMIDLGADVIFGGHPHVAEPTEIIEKDGEKKFIIYSMGNLLSNQRYETIQNYWSERGVIMEVELTKDGDKTSITNIVPHPTWVSKELMDGKTYTQNGVVNQSYDYQVFLAEDYLKGAKYADKVPAEQQQRIETAYNEMIDLLDLKWPNANIKADGTPAETTSSQTETTADSSS